MFDIFVVIKPNFMANFVVRKLTLRYSNLSMYFLCFSLLLNIFLGIAQNNETDITEVDYPIDLAEVKLDGNVLFMVRGISVNNANKRASDISARIKNIASNNQIDVESIRLLIKSEYITIYSVNDTIMRVFDADAAVEGTGISKELLAKANQVGIKNAITTYRVNRSSSVLLRNSGRALLAIFIGTVFLLVSLWLMKKVNTLLQKRIKKRIDSVDDISFSLIKSEKIWRVFELVFRAVRILFVFFVSLFVLDYVLSLFPWTNEFSNYLLKVILDPLKEIGWSIINYLPKFIFLLIIWYIIKNLLRLIKLFFTGLEDGEIIFRDFKPEWAMSTFKIVKVVIISFAVVIAYPYIPGSDSIAFKGVSVFVGILFSLGSTTFISNVVAGYSMIYRGAFKKGDYIEVNGQTGFVEEQKLLVTRIRSHKNEEVIIPNSILLNSQIKNFSVKAEELGVVLHTMVGIGYETPWRLVDAMLKLAAKRTEGLLSEPPPYVLKKALADYAVNYEINAYCKDVNRINAVYSALHQNILDVFNENNVQIMTPSYEADTEIPKMVAKKDWDPPLASKE